MNEATKEEREQLEQLMRRADGGDELAADQLFTTLYSELRRLAQSQLHRHQGVLSLGATTLVHEAYLRMLGPDAPVFPDQARFFAYASKAMRGLAIDYSRRRRTQKRGRQLETTPWDDEAAPVDTAAVDLSALGDALEELATLDASLAELVDLHFFGGMTFVEIASLRVSSERTVQRDWQKARLLLHRSLRDDLAFQTLENAVSRRS
jgi:RNA polymerase sigma factor (TIGR02999 family)